MRILELHLIAFGPFTDTTLDLSRNDPGLHLIYGPNEAGKTSAMQAIQNLLFGFPHLRSHDFLHRDTRVGGTLENSVGNRISFVRKRGNTRTLLHPQGTVLADDALDPYLGAIQQEAFRRVFSIDHARLRAGGDDMLELKGLMGESLFAASLGGAGLAHLLQDLEGEAKKLGIGTASAFARTLKEYRETTKERLAAEASSHRWDELQRKIDDERRSERDGTLQRNAARVALARCERLRQALPLIRERQLLQSDLAGPESASAESATALKSSATRPRGLPAEYSSEERIKTQTLLNTTETRLAKLGQEIAALDARLGDPQRSELLENEPLIVDLPQRLAVRLEADERRARDAAESVRLRGRAADLWRDLGSSQPLEDLDASRLATDRRVRIQQLAADEKQLRAEASRLARERADLERRQESLLTEWMSLGIDIDTENPPRSLDEHFLNGVPLPETIDGFEEQLRDADSTCRELTQQLREWELEAGATRESIAALRSAAIPTEHDLESRRAERDQLWRRIRAAWLQESQTAVTERDRTAFQLLADEYQVEVQKTDTVADRLRREADRVANLIGLQARLERLGAQRDIRQSELVQVQSQSGQCQAAWRDLWSSHGISEPRPPREMRRWLELRQNLEREYRQLRLRFHEASYNEHLAVEALQVWRASWQEAMRWIDCPNDASAEQAAARLGCWEELLSCLDQWKSVVQRIQATDEEAAQFKSHVRSLVCQLATDLVDVPAVQAASQLPLRLQEVRRRHDEWTKLTNRRAERQSELEEAQAESTALRKRLTAFCELAGVESPDLLAAAESTANAEARRQDRVQEIDTNLCHLSGGASIAEFMTEAAGWNADDLSVRIQELMEEVEVLDRKRDEAHRRLGDLENQCAAFDGSGQAAAADQRAIGLLSRIHDQAERYVQLRLATHILRQQIERYRAENQDPLLAKASDIFARITRHEFLGLKADYNEQGEPVLVGIRANQERLSVEAMSDGTRDPLFLALRLAYLQRQLAAGDRLPFIVDDILIHLDDERAAATLGVLAELAEQTQVLFFTHHQRLRELAELHLPDTTLVVHELERACRLPVN